MTFCGYWVYYGNNNIIQFMSNFHELPRRALDLSLAIYRVTAQLPNGEVLIGQMRQLSGGIAAELNSVDFTLSAAAGDIDAIKKDINRLRLHFQIAKAQNWVKPINWSILDFEYYKLQQEADFMYRGFMRIEGSADSRGGEKNETIVSHNIRPTKKSANPKAVFTEKIRSNLRQTKILDFLDKNEFLKMSDLIPLFDNVSERTLRNELQEMIKIGLIKKSGVNRMTAYFKS